MFKTGIKWLGLACLAFGLAAQSGSASPLTSAEETVCKNIRHCLDILKRHSPTEFDYEILTEEFTAFGQDGKDRLLKAMEDNDPDLSMNAVILLSHPDFDFSIAEIKRIADQWPTGDVKSLANLMIGEYSPPIRQAAISTLSHQEQEITHWSRKILKFGEMDSRSGLSESDRFKPSPEAFEPLTAAAMTMPTREIASFLSQYPAEQAQPILIKLLSSNSPDVVCAALKGLYAFDREQSFTALRDSLQNLNEGEEDIALAIADAVRKQYVKSNDGDFIVFAEQLLTNGSARKLDTLAAADILMGLGPDVKLPETKIALSGLESALSAHSTVPLNYMDGLPQKFEVNLETGLNLLWAAFEEGFAPNKSDFVKMLSAIPPNEASRNILKSALQDQADWKSVVAAAEIVSAQKLTTLEPVLAEAAERHPVIQAKAASLAALDSFTGDSRNYSKSKRRWEQKLASQAKWCPVKPYDFKSESTQLPFFNAVPLAYSHMSSRASIASAISTGKGWLAGYNQGEFSGGLVYYDNRTGAGELIYGQANTYESDKEYYAPNIMGIAPNIQRALGQYGEQYWAFSGLNHLGSEGIILSVFVQNDDVQVSRHFQLPMTPQNIERLDDNSFMIGFGERPEITPSDSALAATHPPLRLMPNGEVLPGCENTDIASTTKTKATP